MVKIKHKNKYSAKLLFQFRVEKNKVSNKKRLCEEKIIMVNANNAIEAYNKISRSGKSLQHNYKNSIGENVYYELVGIIEILKIDESFDENEVWYEHKRMLLPKERKNKIIPNKRQLSAFVAERNK
jgi:hypothetical protein